MKNIKKIKIIITAIVLGVFIFGVIAVVGEQNNKVYASSNPAEIGKVLNKPEEGWQRIDDKEIFENCTSKIGEWRRYDSPLDWKGGYTAGFKPNDSITFKFFGTKFRFIAQNYTNRSEDNKVIVDGVEYTYNSKGAELHQVLYLDLQDLEESIHEVTIKVGTDGGSVVFDAIDIDQDGCLVIPEGNVGDRFDRPAYGWKRYENTDTKIEYDSDWSILEYPGTSGGSISITTKDNSKASFKFIGTAIRIIGYRNSYKTGTCFLKVDDKIYEFSENGKEQPATLVCEVKGLSNEKHSVELYATGVAPLKTLALDAIDVDGRLVSIDEEENAQSISLDKISMNLLEGNSEKLTATVLPDNAINKDVVWTSSNESAATVDKNGNVTAVKEGQATIMAKVDGTELTATCIVNVTKAQLPPEQTGNAILSITLVNGTIKQYDVSMNEVEKFIGWYETRTKGEGSNLYAFPKKESPYNEIKEYIAQDKIASFEVKEYSAK